MDVSKLTYDRANSSFTPEECIFNMFASTDESGNITMSHTYLDADLMAKEEALVCHMNWSEKDRDSIIEEFRGLYDAFKKLAESYKEGNKASVVFSKPEESSFIRVWETYLKPFEGEGLAELREQTDENDTSEEICGSKAEIYDRIAEIEYEDACKRLESSIMAYQVINTARRLCRLLELNAPKIIINNEACDFAEALVLNAYSDDVRAEPITGREEDMPKETPLEEKVLKCIFGGEGTSVIMADELAPMLEEVLSELDDFDKDIFLAFVRDGKTDEEIAELFEMTAQEVRSHRAKALRMLRNPSRSKRFRKYVISEE